MNSTSSTVAGVPPKVSKGGDALGVGSVPEMNACHRLELGSLTLMSKSLGDILI